MTENEKLRQLLLELYVSSVLWQDHLPAAEQQRLLDTVLAAAEGEPFELLGLPFPAKDAPQPKFKADLDRRVRAYAESQHLKRSEAVRQLIEVGLTRVHEGDDG